MKYLLRLFIGYLTLGLLGIPGMAQVPENTVRVTVAQLPSAANGKHKTYLVTDATTTSDCTIGGGTLNVRCTSRDGATWTSDTADYVPKTLQVAGHALNADVTIADADLSTTDVTTNNATSSKHGFLPKLSGSSSDVLKGDGTFGAVSSSAHNLLSATHSDTTTASATRGDGLFAVGATPTWQRVAKPSVTGGYFKWNGTDIVASTGAASGTGSCTNQAVTALTTDAAPTCTTLTSAYVNTSIAQTGVDINTSHQVTATHLSAALPIAQGGTANTTGVQTYVLFATTTAPACTNGGGTTTFLGVSGAGNTTETSVARYVVPLAGTVKNLRVWLGGNVPASQSAVVKVVLGGAAQTNPTCTIAAGAAVCNDTSNTLAVVAGDTLNVQINCSGGTNALNARAAISFTIQQ
jgi:hypothetical protein